MKPTSTKSRASSRIIIGALAGTTALSPAFAQVIDQEPSEIGDEIIVTASPLARTVDETIVGTSVVNKEELARNLQNTVAETISREPGISTTYFGPAASRPIIRGLGEDRVRVLDNGIGAIDASVASPDHAVSIDPASAERVEIVRGPATLLYGSSAAGGVVNVISGRIPSSVPEDGFDVSGTLGASTADDGFDGAGAFDLKLGNVGSGSIVLHGDGFYREAEDYDIPGFAESGPLRAEEAAEGGEEGEEEEEEAFGTLPNSFYETSGASGGLSWVGERGYFGVSGTVIDSEYGLAGGKKEEEEGEGEEEEGEEEEGAFIDLRQRRIDFAGEYRFDGWLEKAVFRLGYADYQHIEFEAPGEPGTTFTNEGWEGRLEFVNRAKPFLGGTLRGAQGFQFRLSEFSAIGEEAFIPPTDTAQYGVFLLKEYSTGPWRIDLGGRYENTRHEVLDSDFDGIVPSGFARDFDSFSVSGGVGYNATEQVFLGVNAFRTERAPSATELFANGPHLATNAFEIGDATLDEEVATGVEGTFRYTNDLFRFVLNGFYTSYQNFIILDATGLFAEEDEVLEEFVISDDDDGLPVFEFEQDDADFYGFEASVEAELFRTGGFHFHGDLGVDYVRATRDTGADQDLPRIPPLSGVIGLEARHEYGDLRFETELVAEQDDIAEFELPTDGYQMLNLYATVRPLGANSPFAVRLAASNLTDQDARVHASFRKDTVPLRGRNFRISITGEF
ncbi:MAG: TonB-dependent receptor [Alphaproteobacteria bacterium]|nr:TonB-dependent receptor [Alphaproteobacteria bacterium]